MMTTKLPQKYIKLKLKSQILEETGLPDIGYPVPLEILESISPTGDIPFPGLLFWLQEYSEIAKDEWQLLEPSLKRLSELIAPEDDRENITVYGDNWFLEVMPVDLAKEIITIQRGDHLLVAISPREDFRLGISVFQSLDAKSIQYLIDLSRNPHPEYGVCMRPNNWEYALDQSAGSSSAYASTRGESYLSYWKNGLGIYASGEMDSDFRKYYEVSPLMPNLVAIQIGTYYELKPDDI